MTRPAPAHHTPNRLTAAVRLLASGSALTAAVAGIPYVLLTTLGAPWPSQVTSFNDLATRLAQPISDPFVLQILALVGWACWAYFTTTMLREALWLLRRLPTLVRDTALLRRHTATLPAHRAAAALLVGTLLIALIAMWRLPVAHATAPAANPVTAPVATAAPLHAPPTRTARPEHATYIVQPGDTLWAIAEQHLGDPLHWPKIYQLSCAIRQSDGELLSDPDHIQPGWRLHLPVHNAPAPAPHPPRPSTETPAPSPITPTPTPEPEKHQPPDRSEHGNEHRHTDRQQQDGRTDPDDRPVTIPLGTASAIGVTTAAGIAAALGFARWHAARRRTPSLNTLATPLEDDDLQLGQALHRSNQAHLASRATRHHNPDTMTRRTAPADPQQPGTVTIAERAYQEVHIDALAVPGGVHLGGPGAESAARHLLIAIAGAAQRLRPTPPRVQLLADTATVRRLLPGIEASVPAWTLAEHSTEAVQLAEHALLEHARHQQRVDTEALEPDAPALHVLLLDGESPDTNAGRLEALAARADVEQARRRRPRRHARQGPAPPLHRRMTAPPPAPPPPWTAPRCSSSPPTRPTNSPKVCWPLTDTTPSRSAPPTPQPRNHAPPRHLIAPATTPVQARAPSRLIPLRTRGRRLARCISLSSEDSNSSSTAKNAHSPTPEKKRPANSSPSSPPTRAVSEAKRLPRRCNSQTTRPK